VPKSRRRCRFSSERPSTIGAPRDSQALHPAGYRCRRLSRRHPERRKFEVVAAEKFVRPAQGTVVAYRDRRWLVRVCQLSDGWR